MIAMTATSRNIRNANIKSVCADGYVLKILNSFDSMKTEFIEGQTALSLYLSKCTGGSKEANPMSD